MPRLRLALLIGLAGFLASAPIARAVAVYTYDGNVFDNIRDEDPPAGSYDTSMKVTGSVTFESELAPNRVFGDVTADVVSFVLDDGRLSIDSLDAATTDFSFFVSTDLEGKIVNWAIFAEALRFLGEQQLETHQIVSRTGGSAFDRGLLFVEEMDSLLGTDHGLNGNPAAWVRVPVAQMIVVAERADDVFTPASEFLLGVNVILDDAAAADLTSITAAFGGTVLPLVQEDFGEWEGETEYADFAALEAAIGGIWTVTLAGGALASTNTFMFDTSSLTDADFFATPTNLSSGDGETGVAADVVLSWDDPTGPSLRTPAALIVLVEGNTTDQEANNLVDMLDPNYIALDATMWDPLDDLETGPTEFAIFYADADDSFVSAIDVTPPGAIVWRPPDFFPIYPIDKPFLALASETIVEFSVPEPSAAALSSAALAALGLIRLASRRRRR
jgi:hypothetical protein